MALSLFYYKTDSNDNNVSKPYKVDHHNNAVKYCGNITQCEPISNGTNTKVF